MLLWLVVCTPFVYSSQQEIKKDSSQNYQHTDKADDSSNPLNNTNEEKSETSANTLSEFLHTAHCLEHHFIQLPVYYKCHSSDLYLAFHPETISPPPDQA